MKKTILFLLFLTTVTGIRAQEEIPIDYIFGEKYNDRYKYSNLLAMSEDKTNGYILVRSYYTGIVLRPKGYLIEYYDKDLELVSEYNYKLKGRNFVSGYMKNGQVYLLFLDYDYLRSQYVYSVHHSPLDDMRFTEEKLLSITSREVNEPLDRNYYNRNFKSGFTTTVLFNEDKSAFMISTHHKKGDDNKHTIHLYNATLTKLMEYDFSAEVADKNYAFEYMVLSPDKRELYLMGKAYFKKKRFKATERKFQYELIKITENGYKIQNFADPGRYPESLKPVFVKDKLVCVGFYADRKDNRYNGIAYFEVDPGSLAVLKSNYNGFDTQFMKDKFGQEEEKAVKNLVFKGVHVTEAGELLFNAEEYFVSNSIQTNSAGGRIKVERYHHNDIVSVKLDAQGNMVWARNINKLEVTQGDGAYASYSSYSKDGTTYFFICTAADNPQQLGRERLIFRQGFSRNRNVFVIKLNEKGYMDFEKIIGSEEARLPLMVSKPLVNHGNNQLLFYAKRGTKKQLVKVAIR